MWRASTFASHEMRRSAPPSEGVKPTKWRPGRVRVLVGHVRERTTRGVEHPEVADERLERGAEAGRRHDRVRAQPAAVGEHDLGIVEGLDRGHDLDVAALDRAHDPHVHDRDPRMLDEARDRPLLRRQPLRGEVGEADAAQRARDRVDRAPRQLPEQDPDRLDGDADRVPADDVRRGTDGEPDRRGPAVVEVDGDLGAGVPRPDDERRPAAIGPGAPVVPHVDEVALEGVASGPVGERRLAVLSRRDDDPGRGQVAAARPQHPALAVAVDPLDGRPRADVELVRVGVVAEVRPNVVACDPGPVRARDRVSGQAREAAVGVQPEPVVAPRPGGARLFALLEDDRADPLAAEHRGDGEARRSGADDGDRAHGRSVSRSSAARKRKKKTAKTAKKTSACSPAIVTPAIC